MIPLQRIGLYNWGVVPDLSRAKLVGPLMVALWGIPGVISLICLIANRDFFNTCYAPYQKAGRIDHAERQ